MFIGRKRLFAENWSVAVGIGATAALWTYTVPHKGALRFTGFGNYLGTVAAWGTAYWYLTQNGVPVELVGATPNILDQVGYAAQRQAVTDYEFNGGNLLILYGVNPTLAILNMGISISWEELYPYDV